MNIEHVKEFAVLASTQNYYEAAERLFISQPTLTKHISKLETELGFELFVRSYPIRLTNAGRFFLEKIGPLLHEIDAITNTANLINKGYSGVLTIGIPKHTKIFYMNAIRRFIRSYKEIFLKVELLDPNDLFSKLVNDEIDIALGLYKLDMPQSRMLDQFSKTLRDEGKLCAIVNAADDRFRDRRTVSIRQLEKLHYMLIDNAFYRGIFHNYSSLAGRYGVDTGNRFTLVNNLDEAMYGVFMEDGYTVAPYVEDIHSYGLGLKALAFEEDDFRYMRYDAWKKENQNPAIEMFINKTKLMIVE